ncbi:unnamed protein product [Vitrella brassicaformis CCMP3155]|uniref:Uncharacterized protein n=1 Tax=Vitrella brassicaformis (strain CCMP3155) TaxID=1169540 RepID=A0A0G4FTZ7_VITBC|nr:unnamed protein product [Vitrella brassicaformis CCMP3155]|eukprot:CEM18437.1 unnamed protein product [Vitrella brassicaformis CCMP3155]
MSAAAREGAAASTDDPSSSAASAAANGASSASSQQQQLHHHQDTTLSGVLGVATLMPRIAQHVTSYSQLAYFRLIDIDRRPPISPVRAVSLTPDVVLPILMRLLPIVVASLGLCVLVEVPIPQLSQGVAVTVALTRALIEQLSRRLWIGEGRQRHLMDGDKNFCCGIRSTYYVPTLLSSASPLFRHAPFDLTDPHTQLAGGAYPNYTSMVAFELFRWLITSGHIKRIRAWATHRRDSAASRRVSELLAASPSDAGQWGATVVDTKRESGWRYRLVVLGSEAMGEGQVAAVLLADGVGDYRSVEIFTTESAPHDQTRTVVMRVLGFRLGNTVLWRFPGCTYD